MEKNNKNLTNQFVDINLLSKVENLESENDSKEINEVQESLKDQIDFKHLQTDPPQDPKPILKNFGFEYPIMIIPDGSPPKGFYVVPIH